MGEAGLGVISKAEVEKIKIKDKELKGVLTGAGINMVWLSVMVIRENWSWGWSLSLSIRRLRVGVGTIIVTGVVVGIGELWMM